MACSKQTWGVVKETAAPNKTLCDYDGHLPSDLLERVSMVRSILSIRPHMLRIDKTKHGYHLVIVWSETLSKAETVAIQAILGSDYKRELLNLMRVRSKAKGKFCEQFWNILYDHRLP